MREVSDDRLVRGWLRKALNLLTIAVVAYFLASAAVLFSLDPQLPLPATVLDADRAEEKSSIPTLEHFAPIVERNAFKAASPEPEETAAPIDELPLAQLDAKLLGTFYFDFPTLSRAVTLEGNEQKLVKIGDTVGGYEITEIQRGAVVLERGGKRHQLLIDAEDAGGRWVAPAMTPAAPVMGGMPDNAPRFQQEVPLPGDSVAPVFQDAPVVKVDKAALARSLQMEMSGSGDEKGLLVKGLRDGSPFSNAGLMKGDVVTSIGGKTVESGLDPKAPFAGVDGQIIEMTVIRDGEPVMLLVPVTGQ